MLFKVKGIVKFCKQYGDKYRVIIQDKETNMLQTIYSNKCYNIGEEYEFIIYNKVMFDYLVGKFRK
jgi:hypothetical protein